MCLRNPQSSLLNSSTASFVPQLTLCETTYLFVQGCSFPVPVMCWSETKLQRSEGKTKQQKNTDDKSSPAAHEKRKCGRSANVIKKTGNVIAMKKTLSSFFTKKDLMCLRHVPEERCALRPRLLCICVQTLYISNWVGVSNGISIYAGLFPSSGACDSSSQQVSFMCSSVITKLP